MADQQTPETSTVEQLLDSNLESVDAAEELALREAGALEFDDDDMHKIGIAVRECMVNAVVHGNRYNSRKKVHFKIERTPGRLVIWIGDEGEGFDPAGVPDPLAGENLLRHSGRGVLLMQAFMDEFSTSTRQPKGTEVKMVKYRAKAGGEDIPGGISA